MKKKIMSISIILFGVIFICGCGNTKLKNGSEVAFKTKGKNFSADSFYTEIKKKYGVSVMIDMIDKQIFNNMYKDDEEIEKKVVNQIENLKQQYSDSWEETLKGAGYDSEDKLKEELTLNLKKEKAVKEQVKKNIKEDEIKKYYEENSAGDISAKHILIKVDTSSEDGLTDDEAKEKAEKLIKELDKGADFSKLAKKNSDDTGSKEKGGDLGYFNKGDMVKEFEEAAYALKVNEYTKEPVKTSYGYHIILKTGEKEKPKYKDIKDKIIETLTEQKLTDDSTLNITVLDEIRNEKGLKINDSRLKKEYKKYIKNQIEAAEKAKEQAQQTQ